jgi:DNA polymerase-3 subunit delta
MSFKPEIVAKKSLVMLSGDEDTLRARGLAQILEHLGVQRDDFDLENMAADSSEPVQWTGSAGTAPFMAERRIVIVRHVLRYDPADVKPELFSGLPEFALLLLVADSEIALTDTAESKFSRHRTKWESIVKAAGGHTEKFTADAKDLHRMVKAEITAAGKKISDRAVETLLEMTGGSYSRAMDEAQKLVLFVGSADEIREHDVKEVAVPSRDWNVFKLIDSIASGSVPEGLRQLRILVGNRPKPEDAVLGRVMPMFSRHFRLLWQARLCIEAQCQPSSAPTQVLSMFPSKPNFAAESAYRQKLMMSSAKGVTLPQIESCLKTLSLADARLKGLEPAFSAIDTLDRMVLQLARDLKG